MAQKAYKFAQLHMKPRQLLRFALPRENAVVLVVGAPVRRGGIAGNRCDRTRDNWSLATKRIVIIIQNYKPRLYQLSYRTVMPTGFEPALFRTRALIWRLRPLGHGITKL